jgi:hypothetical protein
VKWRHNRTIELEGVTRPTEAGTALSSLLLEVVGAEQGGRYDCLAATRLDNVTSRPAFLKVQGRLRKMPLYAFIIKLLFVVNNNNYNKQSLAMLSMFTTLIVRIIQLAIMKFFFYFKLSGFYRNYYMKTPYTVHIVFILIMKLHINNK